MPSRLSGEDGDIVPHDSLALEWVWKGTVVALESHDPAVRDAVMRVSAVHWFDERIVKTLCHATPDAPNVLEIQPAVGMPPDLLIVALESLPFVEAYDDDRLRIHAQVRTAVVTELERCDPAFLNGLSKAVAADLGERGELDFDELLELAFHLLIAEPASGANLVDAVFGISDLGSVAYLDRLMSYVTELRDSGRLSPQLVERSALWSVRTAAASGDYERAVRLAERGMADVSPDSEVADELTLQLAYAELRRGHKHRARDLGQELAARPRGTTWQPHALLLLGDLADAIDDALTQYESALNWFVDIDENIKSSGVLDGARWSLVESSQNGLPVDTATYATEEGTADDADAPLDNTFVAYQIGDEVALIEPNNLFAEIWLRIGECDGRAGRIANAPRWLSLAAQLFALVNDTEGFQRVQKVEQWLAARRGDIKQLQEVVERQEQLLAWTQATGDAQLALRTLLDLAEASVGLGRLDAARARYEEAEILAEQLDDPGSIADIAEGLAQVAISDQRFDDADRHLKRATQLAASLGLARARQLDEIVGERWQATGDLDRARDAYARVLEWASAEDYPDNEARARIALSRVARAKFDLTESELQLREADSLAPRLDPLQALDVLAELATILRLQQRDDEAETLEAKVETRAAELSLKEMLADRLLYRAEMAARRGDMADAQIVYTHALGRFEEMENDDRIFQALLGLSWAASEAGDDVTGVDAAERAAEMARKAGRTDWVIDALAAVGTACVAADRPDDAIQALQEAQRRQPWNADLATNLGWAYLRADRFDESIRWSRKALELEPNDAFPYRNVGHALLGLGRLEEAKEAYAKAIAGRFGDDHFHNTLAELDLLARRNRGLRGLDEVVAWFRSEQERLDSIPDDR